MDTYQAYVFTYPNRFNGRILSYFTVPKRNVPLINEAKETERGVKDMGHPLRIPHSKWVWVHNKLPPHREFYYNFTYFAFTLNEIEPYMKMPGVLCPTDSRFRPDVRLYENGLVDAADAAKAKLENAQRMRAQAKKEEEWVPRWFVKSVSPHTGEEHWVFKGDYWNRNYKYDSVLNNLFVLR